jgi:O-antigen ligase
MWSEAGKFAVSQYHGYISLTFPTPNDAGTFLVLLLPLSFALIINSSGIRKIICTFLSALLALLLFLTGSSAALYAFFASLIVLVLIYRRQLLKAYKGVAAAVLIVVLLLTAATFIKGNAVLAPLTGGGKGTFTTQGRNLFHVDELQLDKDRVLFKGDQNTFVVQASKTGLVFLDQNSNPVNAVQKGDNYTFSQSPFQTISLTAKGSNFEVDLGYKSPVLFTLQNGVVYAVGPNGTLLNTINDNSGLGFKNMQSFATGRGYIWRKSLPLLSQTLFIGYGADNTVFHIPQNDFAGKLNYQGSASILIDKPHDLFLQTALNTGLPSLLALLILFAVFAVRSAKELIFSKKITRDTTFNRAFVLGIARHGRCTWF